ncbi:hypothetical protein Nmel_012323 [Mimus melanotis]
MTRNGCSIRPAENILKFILEYELHQTDACSVEKGMPSVRHLNKVQRIISTQYDYTRDDCREKLYIHIHTTDAERMRHLLTVIAAISKEEKQENTWIGWS